jgi:hypothetical protein
MIKAFFPILFLFGSLSSVLFSSRTSAAQIIDTAYSEHLRLRMPAERQTLGRDAIAELELCYAYMDRATGAGLPRKVSILVSWDQSESSCSYRDGSISIGMNRPAASAAPRRFLLHNAAREMAHLGLLRLSQGARPADAEFLFEGMIEILTHEYEHSSRALDGAWIISGLLDKMQILGLSSERSWSTFSGGRRCFRNAAPGITFITTFREDQGRDRPLKFFESLRSYGVSESLEIAFKAPAPELESAWLKKVREYDKPAGDITVAADEVPQLLKTSSLPEAASPGSSLEIRIYLRDAAGNVLPQGVFLTDAHAGRVVQPKAVSEKGVSYFSAVIPIEAGRPPGEYNYELTVVDESGNLRCWDGKYRVK